MPREPDTPEQRERKVVKIVYLSLQGVDEVLITRKLGVRRSTVRAIQRRMKRVEPETREHGYGCDDYDGEDDRCLNCLDMPVEWVCPKVRKEQDHEVLEAQGRGHYLHHRDVLP